MSENLDYLLLPEEFKDSEFLCVIPHRRELGEFDDLAPEVKEWMREQAPNAKFTCRSDSKRGGKIVLIFKFHSDAEMVHFKMRWWD